MKKNFILLFLIVLSWSAKAQILTPVKWSYAAKKLSSTEAVVFIKGTIDDGWHVYSQNIKEGGPVKTAFSFTPSKKYLLVGKTQEPKPIVRMEKVFNMEVGYFENSVIFQQKVKLNSKTPFSVKGQFEYMTCNDRQCLPPETVEFEIAVK